jgi:hypothetical protein
MKNVLLVAAGAFLLITQPGVTQERTCRYDTSQNATNVLLRESDEAFAELVINNRLAFRSEDFCQVTIFGVTITVEYQPGPQSRPDWFYVTVPDGFRADPASVLLEDGTTFTVTIWLDPASSS